MRAPFLALAAALLTSVPLFAETDYFGDEIPEYDRNYLGVSASMVLPQNGAHPHRRAGATARYGRYLGENFAIEGEASFLEDTAGLAVRGLFHLCGWEWFGKMFGYERFDPFCTIGADGWVDGNVGPSAGLGAYYHLTDSWSLRFDFVSTLGLDGDVAMIYTLGAGACWSF